MIVIAIANRKGGVGKTATAVSLAAAFALRGKRVLLIDADSQGNATSGVLDTAKVKITHSLADVLVSDGDNEGETRASSIAEVVTETQVENLSLVAASPRLSKFEREASASAMLRLQILLRAKDVARKYDITVIDTPTQIGFLLSAALAAATHVVIPVQAEPLPLSGINKLMSAIGEARAVNKKIEVLGALCTMLDERVAIGPQVFETIKSDFPGRTFATPINRQVKLAECPAAHQPIQLYAPKSRGAVQYGLVADEILGLVIANGSGRGAARQKN